MTSRGSADPQPVAGSGAPAVPIAGLGTVLVCVPTYNERDSLPGTLARVRAAVPEAHVLVVDDASPDGTGELADTLAVADPAIRVLHRGAKCGLGAAYTAAFLDGLAAGYDVLVEMDADASHRPEDLPRLLAALLDGPGGPADLVLGSRWVPGGQVHNWPARRAALSRAGNAYVRLALGVQVRDATGGFRAYRREVLERIDLTRVTSQGYCFQVDLVWQALQHGFRVREVPITFVERVAGESKMSQRIVLEALVKVSGWALSHRLGRSGSPPGA